MKTKATYGKEDSQQEKHHLFIRVGQLYAKFCIRMFQIHQCGDRTQSMKDKVADFLATSKRNPLNFINSNGRAKKLVTMETRQDSAALAMRNRERERIREPVNDKNTEDEARNAEKKNPSR